MNLFVACKNPSRNQRDGQMSRRSSCSSLEDLPDKSVGEEEFQLAVM